MFFDIDMKFSSIVKQCINYRNSLIEDGYHADHFRIDNIYNKKFWRFKHPNGHIRNVMLDIRHSTWIVTNEHGLVLIKQIANA